MKDMLIKYFQLNERGTDIKTELIAGTATFLIILAIVSIFTFIIG